MAGLVRAARSAGPGGGRRTALWVLVTTLILPATILPSRASAAGGSPPINWDGTYAVNRVTVTCPSPGAGSTPSAEAAIPRRVTVAHSAVSGRPISAAGQAEYSSSTGTSGVGFVVSVRSDGTYSFSAMPGGGAAFVARGTVTVASIVQNQDGPSWTSSVTCTANFSGIRGGLPATATARPTATSGAAVSPTGEPAATARSPDSPSFPTALVGAAAGLLLVLLVSVVVVRLRRSRPPAPSPPGADPASVFTVDAPNPGLSPGSGPRSPR